jgi:hypothetical protein
MIIKPEFDAYKLKCKKLIFGGQFQTNARPKGGLGVRGQYPRLSFLKYFLPGTRQFGS